MSTNPDHAVEVRTQWQQSADENWDVHRVKQYRKRVRETEKREFEGSGLKVERTVNHQGCKLEYLPARPSKRSLLCIVFGPQFRQCWGSPTQLVKNW
eukprot:sb/3479101/